MKLEPKVEDSTWVHPQPEVILPSLIPLVFERFFAYFNFVVVPKQSSNFNFVVVPKQSSKQSRYPPYGSGHAGPTQTLHSPSWAI